MGSGRKKNAGSSRSATDWSPETKKLIKSVREVVNLPEPEIYAVLKECNMDPNETVQRLLSQDMFQEVKSKRERRKELKDTQESRARIRSESERSTATYEEFGTFAPKEENVLRAPSPPLPPLQGEMSDQHFPSIHSDSCPDSRGQSLDTATGQSHGHLSMADIVKMGRPVSLNQCHKPSPFSESLDAEWPNLSENPNVRPELSTSEADLDSNDDEPRISQSVETHDPETIISASNSEPGNVYNSSDRDFSATLSNDVTESPPEPEERGGVIFPSHLVLPPVDSVRMSFGTFKPEDTLPSTTQDVAPTLETSNTGKTAHEEFLGSLYAGRESTVDSGDVFGKRFVSQFMRPDASETPVRSDYIRLSLPDSVANVGSTPELFYPRAEPNTGNLFNQSQQASTESPPNALIASRESDTPYSQYLANQAISNTAMSFLQDRKVSPLARTRHRAEPNIPSNQQRSIMTNYSSLQGNFTQLPSSQQQAYSPRNNTQQYGASMSGRYAGNVFPNYQQYSPRNSPPVPPNAGYERIFRPQNPVRDRFPLQQPSGSSSSWNMGGQQMTPLPREFGRHGLLDQSHLHLGYRQPQPQPQPQPRPRPQPQPQPQPQPRHRFPQYNEAMGYANLYRGPQMGVPRHNNQHQQNRGGNVSPDFISYQLHNMWRHQQR